MVNLCNTQKVKSNFATVFVQFSFFKLTQGSGNRVAMCATVLLVDLYSIPQKACRC